MKIVKSVSMDQELWDRLDDSLEGVPRSVFVSQAVEKALGDPSGGAPVRPGVVAESRPTRSAPASSRPSDAMVRQAKLNEAKG